MCLKERNKRQYVFNEEVHETIHVTQQSLTREWVSHSVCQSFQCESVINNKQKLVKVADRLEHGWVTVEEYVMELADTLNNERDCLVVRWVESWKLLARLKLRSHLTRDVTGCRIWNTIRPQLPNGYICQASAEQSLLRYKQLGLNHL